MASTGIGNAIEWYDWTIYATFSPFFATQFFDPSDRTSAVLATLAVFAVGFIARPFGGFLFGWIGDRLGRKVSMTLVVGISSAGSLMIALAPHFATVGALASLVLLTARLLQGLAHGGELPSAQTYLSEVAPREKRGLWSSFMYVSGTLGVIGGSLLGVVLSSVLSAEQMGSFGWRIPFLIGAALGLFALFMRARMPETEAFEGNREKTGSLKKPSIIKGIIEHRKQALQVIGLTVGLTVIYQLWAVFAPAFASNSLKINSGQALLAGSISNVAFILALPLWGMLSDRIGRKPVLLIGALSAAVLHFPMIWLLQDSAWQLAISMSVMLVFVAAMASIVPAVYAELFPADIRTTGVGVPYACAVALFGGTAGYLQSLFTDVVQQAWLFNLYAVVLLLITAFVIRSLPETRARDLND
nr:MULTISPECIES: MFS transporter [unclassified Cryobacterium]